MQVKALEAAMAAKQAEEARAQEKAARQQRHKEQQAAAAAAAAVSRPEAGAGKAEGRLNVGFHKQVHGCSIASYCCLNVPGSRAGGVAVLWHSQQACICNTTREFNAHRCELITILCR